MAVVNEVPLPGIGVRYDFVTEDGSRVGVIHHRTGEREIVLYEHDDPGALGKYVTGWFGARRVGIGLRGRQRAGVALIARGEFSIVIAGLAVATGAEPELGPLSATYVLLLAIAGPMAAHLVRRGSARVR